jgi:hypothetical protein
MVTIAGLALSVVAVAAQVDADCRVVLPRKRVAGALQGLRPWRIVAAVARPRKLAPWVETSWRMVRKAPVRVGKQNTLGGCHYEHNDRSRGDPAVVFVAEDFAACLKAMFALIGLEPSAAG